MKFTFIITLLFIVQNTFALSPEEGEIALEALHSKLAKSMQNELSDSLCNEMREVFISTFDHPETFDYPFEKLQMCKLISSDHHIRLFNWNLPYQDGTHKYFCFVLVWEEKEKNFTWSELKDAKNDGEKIENRYLNTDKWLGALYYDIIPMTKKGRGDTYTLLGWDGKDNLTTRKIIDAVTITNKKIRIGAGIFGSDDGVRKRMILEFSNDVSASVKYYPKKLCIVMDHLSPKNPMMTGIFADYGPDGTYDLLMMKKGKWEFMKDIDITEFTSDSNKHFYDPQPQRRRKGK